MHSRVIPAPLDAEYLTAFCQRISPEKPLAVRCQPRLNQTAHECFAVVAAAVAAQGGEQVTGWALWTVPGVYVEAEFHAVWRTPAGELLDIARPPQAFTEISFLPDPVHRYRGRQIDNIRQALVEDIDVTRFLFLARRRFEILNTGDLAHQHGRIALPKALGRAYEETQKELARLQQRLYRRYFG